jgi:cyclophilin family peptidyl-prolyl cis-trans isomerase
MAEDVTTVVLESTDGRVVLEIHPEWAPLGAARFIELVEMGFYDGAPVFRNMQGFMAQFGIPPDPALTAEWQQRVIADDPVLETNTPGRITFAMAGPNTRTFQVFINKEDNSGLDSRGFAPFGEVVDGMDVVQGWHITGDATVNQGLLSQQGITYFNQVMPDGDIIERAYIQE